MVKKKSKGNYILIKKGTNESAKRLVKHLIKEHPSVKGKIKIISKTALRD